jgi:hypothetical protein
MNFLALWIAIGVFIISLIIASVISRRYRTYYKVYLANNDTLRGFRTGWDKLWRSDESGIMVFHLDDGKSTRISKHWIIKIEEE